MEFKILKEELQDSSFLAQRGMWHLKEQRMRDAREGETNESENEVRECKAMAEEGSLSCGNQIKETGLEHQPREVRQDFGKNEAALGRCLLLF